MKEIIVKINLEYTETKGYRVKSHRSTTLQKIGSDTPEGCENEVHINLLG